MKAERQEETAAKSNEDAFTGLGIGLGLTLFGLLCIGFLPAYLGTTSDGWRIFWSLTGGIFGLVGLGGAFFELSKILDVKGWDDLGLVVVLGGLAGILHVIQSNGDGSWTVAVRIVVVFVLLLAVVGSGTGVARIVAASKRREDREDRPRGVAVLSVVTGLVGLATALLNFMAAGGPTP